jgi:hypothetical protein
MAKKTELAPTAEETVINTQDVNPKDKGDVPVDNAQPEEQVDNKDKPKKEKVLSEKELAKKAEQERIARINELRIKKYEQMFAADNDLSRRQLVETRNIKQNLIRYSIVILVGLALGGFLATMNVLYSAVSSIFLLIGGINIFKALRLKKLIKNPYEIKKIIIIEQARKLHEDRNKKIVEAYKKEKKRIKMLQRLPFKILNYVTFFITMFILIFFFFILDIGIAPTALLLFGMFTVVYFIVGLLMHLVFFMISENKQRELMLKLENEKNRLLTEERIKSEEIVKYKIEKERIKYEEEERLRIEEQIRAKKEEEERLKKEEEERLEREAEEHAIAEAEAEKERLVEEAKIQFLQPQDLLPPPPTLAELAHESEVIRNEIDKKILTEINKDFKIPNISGIEDFSDKGRLKIEFAAGAIIPEIDSSEDSVNAEIDGGVLHTIPEVITESDELSDIQTSDIEEAKQLIFQKAKRQQEAKAHKSSAIPGSEPEFTSKDLMKESTKPQQGGGVSGKSFMVIKQMLKDK